MRATRPVAVLLLILGLGSGGAFVPASAQPACAGLPATITGTSGADFLVGTEGADVVVLLDGDDYFSGGGGRDVVCGGAGADHVGENIGGSFYGGAGNDSFGSSTGSFFGEDGEDLFTSVAGAGRFHGGAGFDTLAFDYADSGTLIDRAAGTATIGRSVQSFVSVEVFRGSPYADRYEGHAGVDAFSGGDGPDRIRTYGGADSVDLLDGDWADTGHGRDHAHLHGDAVVQLGPGEDFVIVGAGGDHTRVEGGAGPDKFEISNPAHASLTGGEGADELSLVNVSSGVRVDLAAGTARWRAGALRLAGLEYVTGSRRADVLIGGAGADSLFGWYGNDVLRGGAGRDNLDGYYGRDAADGGPGSDECEAERERRCERRY